MVVGHGRGSRHRRTWRRAAIVRESPGDGQRVHDIGELDDGHEHGRGSRTREARTGARCSTGKHTDTERETGKLAGKSSNILQATGSEVNGGTGPELVRRRRRGGAGEEGSTGRASSARWREKEHGGEGRSSGKKLSRAGVALPCGWWGEVRPGRRERRR